MTVKHWLSVCLLIGYVAWSAAVAASGDIDTRAEHAQASADPTLRKSYDLELGKKVFTGKCLACHGDKQSGAPQYGDMENWQDRIAQGQDMLTEHALKGHGRMPPKGGLASLSDIEVSAAVAFVFDRSRRMLANRQLDQSICSEDETRCDRQNSEETMILHMLWLLTGGKASGI